MIMATVMVTATVIVTTIPTLMTMNAYREVRVSHPTTIIMAAMIP